MTHYLKPRPLDPYLDRLAFWLRSLVAKIRGRS
jgi:hypothetical protein